MMNSEVTNQVFAFEVRIKGQDHARIINARSAGQAKVEYWRDVRDPLPDLPYTLMRARKVGAVQTSREFVRTAEYRGFPDLKCGQRVLVGTARGVVVGHNASANFDVLFDVDSPQYAGLKLNVHPGSVELIGN